MGNLLLVVAASFACPSSQTPLLLLYASLLAFASGLEASLAPAIEHISRRSPAGWLAQVSGLLLLAAWLHGPLCGAAPTALWEPLLGATALIAGAALRAAAIVRLGARFTSDNHIETGAGLETGGLYRRLAHPSELGLMLLALGAAVFWGDVHAALIVAALYSVTLARLRFEEVALTRHHGSLYAAYRRATFDPFPTLTPRGVAGA